MSKQFTSIWFTVLSESQNLFMVNVPRNRGLQLLEKEQPNIRAINTVYQNISPLALTQIVF